VIVVIGSPIVQVDPGTGAVAVRGLAGRIALAAAAADRRVQLVGKVGDDDAGDALLLALAAGGVNHAAILRDAAHATPLVSETALAADDDPFPADEPPELPAGLPLDAEDVQLALRYLTDFQIVVLAGPLDEAITATAIDAAGFAAAHVIRVDGAALEDGVGPSDVSVTQLEPPADDEPAFAELVGRYAAGLDAGRTPAEAFAAATSGTHWERSAD
jgi:sugar/nucleoside kinase (ribokinase family)